MGKIITLTDAEHFPSLCSSEVDPDVRITGDNTEDIWISHRLSGKKHILQVTNTSRQNTTRCKIRFNEKSDNIVLLDPAYGKGYTIKNNDGYELLLNPAQSYILADEELVKGFSLQVHIQYP